MPSESNAGIVAGLAALFAASGEAATYRRDSTDISVTAVIAETKSSGMDRNGQRVTYRTRDFLVMVEDLESIGKPRSGDRITFGSTVFTVQDGMSGGDCFRYVDEATRTVFRIHSMEK
jgi:hypothetical protein